MPQPTRNGYSANTHTNISKLSNRDSLGQSAAAVVPRELESLRPEYATRTQSKGYFTPWIQPGL
jgi:hypothetical protein